MIEILVYKKDDVWRAVVGNVTWVDKSEQAVINIAQNYVANLGDFDSAAFYYEKQSYPFLVSTFTKEI